MTDALADHLREHGVRHPPRPVMPVLRPHVAALLVRGAVLAVILNEWPQGGPVTDVGSHIGKPVSWAGWA